MTFSKLFKPSSIAVIGASRSRKKIGGAIVANIRSGGFRGKLYPVNPHARSIQGMRSYSSVTEIPSGVDLAVIAIPAPIVARVLMECGRRRIPFVIIISAGFEEIGSEGAARDREIRNIARRYRIRLVGPNCLGVISTPALLNASFSAVYPKPGSVSIITQSGAIMVSLVDWSLEANLGIRTMVSLGNQSGITEIELIDSFTRDSGTKVIGLYLEEISDGPKFMRAVARACRKKPVIVLKAGSSAEGRAAMTSHTGSLAGSAVVFETMIRQAGGILVHDLEDFYLLLRLAATSTQNRSRDIAIVSNAGGPAIVAVDVLTRTDLRLATISKATQTKLKRLLPGEAAVHNPIDLLGDADLMRFSQTLRVLHHDPAVGNLYVIVTPQSMTPLRALARYLVRFNRRITKPLIVSFIGGRSVAPSRRILVAGGVQTFGYPWDALRILALSKERYTHVFAGNRRDRSSQHGLGTGKQLLPYRETERSLAHARLPILRSRFITSPRDLKAVKSFPIVLKAVAKGIVHKQRSGAVHLNIKNHREATRVFNQLRKRFGSAFQGAHAQKMVSAGTEFIVGFTRDPVMKGVLLVGIGGVLTEELNDVALRLGQVTLEQARAMITSLKHVHLTHGCDTDFLARVVVKLSRFVTMHPNIVEIDLNPVVVYESGGMIVDARIIVKTVSAYGKR